MKKTFAKLALHDNRSAVEAGMREALAACGLGADKAVDFVPTKYAQRQVAFAGEGHVAYAAPLHPDKGYDARQLQ